MANRSEIVNKMNATLNKTYLRSLSTAKRLSS